MIMKKTSKENPITFFRKANEARESVVKKSMPKAQTGWATGNARPTYSSKSQRGTDKDYEGKDQLSNSYQKIYRTSIDGKIISRSNASQRANTVGGDETTSYPQKTTVLDTSGYSQGRQSFPAKKASYNIADRNYDWDYNDPNSKPGRTEFSEWSVPRSQVKKTIAEMKSNSGADKSKGTNVNYNSAGTKTVVHTGADGKKYVKVRTNDGKTYNKIMKTGGATKATKFAALAPPYNKATAADRIAGAKKNVRKKK